MKWPNGAKIAFSLAFDLDADTIWRNKAVKLKNGETYLRGLSIGRYSINKGAYRVLDILKKYNIKATWFIPAEIVQKHTDLVKRIISDGHEIGHHGLDHRGEYGDTVQKQISRIEQCNEVFKKNVGIVPVGFRPTGQLLPETLEWVYSDGGFIYSSAGISGEECNYYSINGKITKAVNIPCRDEQLDDYVQTVLNSYPQVLMGMPRIASYKNVYSNWIHELEGMIKYGNSGSTAFHPQIEGTPGRAVMFELFIKYLINNPNIWCARCIDIANYYNKHIGD